MSDAEARAGAALALLWPGARTGLTRLGGRSRSTIFRATGGPAPVVVKVWAPACAAMAARQATRQTDVAQMMTGATDGAARVLLWQADLLALVMEDAGPQDLRAFAAVDAVATLHRAGRWVAAFHAPTLRPHPFRPAGHVGHLERLIAEVRDGTRRIPEPDRFCHLARAVAATGPALRNRPAMRCITHRDLTLANLIGTPTGRVTGIDFENDREDDPLRDLVSLVFETMPLVPDLPLDTAARACSGAYGASLCDAETGLFLQRALALGYWARTPTEPSRRQSILWAAAEQVLSRDLPLFQAGNHL